MTRLIIVRHGQSEANLAHLFAAHTDAKLTEIGRAQAEALAEQLSKTEKIDAVYASDLSRATDTVAPTAARFGLTVIPDEKLREIRAGDWENLPFGELRVNPAYSEDYRMWAEDTADIENGTNDVDDYVTGYVRTDKASIVFNGAWAQNINVREMYVDILGDKGGARLDYCGHFTFWNGADLKEEKPEYDIPDMYTKEDKAFFDSIASGVKDKNNIDSVLESAKLLDALYESASKGKEIAF